MIWLLTHGIIRRGIPPDSYINTLERDTGLREHDLGAAMMNRDVWNQ